MVECNFDTYPVSRMNEYPREINIQWLNTNKWIEGAGEEAIPCVTPAIYNAIFKITGKRIRSVPLKNHDLSWGQTPSGLTPGKSKHGQGQRRFNSDGCDCACRLRRRLRLAPGYPTAAC